MFIGHLPCGYLATAAASHAWPGEDSAERQRRLFTTGLICSVLPDLDLIYYYAVDNQQHLHHSYWTHIPAFWVVVFGLLAPIVLFRPGWRSTYFVALMNIFLHLVLDSIAAEIYWFAPFSRSAFGLVEVPASHSWWVMNFLTHWTFGLEVAVVFAAGWLAWRCRGHKNESGRG